MTKVRSPNYPLVDLSGALAMARKLYEKDGRNKVSRQTLASHLGHDTLSGPALGKLGSLRAYGLVEGVGDDNKITADAITALMAPDGSSDKIDAMRRLAFQPSLFREIVKEYETLPSESNLRYWLVKRGFTPDGAAKAAKTYLRTASLVTDSEREYGYDPSTQEEADAMLSSEPSRTILHPPQQARFYGGGEPLPRPGMRQEVITLDQGDVTILFPENLSTESFEDLEAHLQIFLRKMRRRIAATVNVIGEDEIAD